MTKKVRPLKRPMQRRCQNDLGMSPYKITKGQILSTAKGKRGLQRSKQLLKWICNGTLQNIILLMRSCSLLNTFNHQNDCVLSTIHQLVPATSGKKNSYFLRTPKPASNIKYCNICVYYSACKSNVLCGSY